jgi:hypothetical protein
MKEKIIKANKSHQLFGDILVLIIFGLIFIGCIYGLIFETDAFFSGSFVSIIMFIFSIIALKFTIESLYSTFNPNAMKIVKKFGGMEQFSKIANSLEKEEPIKSGFLRFYKKYLLSGDSKNMMKYSDILLIYKYTNVTKYGTYIELHICDRYDDTIIDSYPITVKSIKEYDNSEKKALDSLNKTLNILLPKCKNAMLDETPENREKYREEIKKNKIHIF